MSNNVDERRKKKNKKKRSNKALKLFLFIIILIVLALVVFVAAVKFMQPDFDFTTLIPESVYTVFEKKEDSTTTTTTTTTTTQKQTMLYLESSDFALENGKKGAFIGNLLNGGKVERDGDSVFHIVDGKGIYRFNNSSESYNLVFKTADKLSSLNVKGEYLYYVNESNNAFCKVSKSKGSEEIIDQGISFAYVYVDSAFCVTTNNEIMVVNLKDRTTNVLYTANDMQKLTFVGNSIDRVFFCVSEENGECYFYCINLETREKISFIPTKKADDIKSMSMENGYMYYHQKQNDGTYNLIRQKIGSEKQVTLAENTTEDYYAVVHNNMVFYAKREKGKLTVYELNMNSNKTKVMLVASGVTDSDKITFQHGGEYDFIIGTAGAGGKSVYKASSNLTSSNNVMNFKAGNWAY